jgi:hypothetical protein
MEAVGFPRTLVTSYDNTQGISQKMVMFPVFTFTTTVFPPVDFKILSLRKTSENFM